MKKPRLYVDMDGVLSPAHQVHPKCHVAVVLADAVPGSSIISMSFRHLINIQQDFLFGSQVLFLPAIFVILFAVFGAGIIEITAFKYRHAFVLLFDPVFHLRKQIGLKLLCAAHHLIQVGILSLQVIHYLGTVRPLAEIVVHPIIVVEYLIAVDGTPMFFFRGNRSCCFHKLGIYR